MPTATTQRYLLLDSRQRHGGLDGWRSNDALARNIVATQDGLSLAPPPASPVDDAAFIGPSLFAIACDGSRVEVDGDEIFVTPPDAADASERRRVCGVGGTGKMPRQFRSPLGIAVDGSLLYVADTGNHRVQVFDSVGWVLRDVFGGPTAGTRPSEFNAPASIAMAEDGDFFVADTGNHRVQKYQRQTKTFIDFDGTALAARVFDVMYGPHRGDRFIYLPALDRLERRPFAGGATLVDDGRYDTPDAARRRVLSLIQLAGAADALMEFDDTYPIALIPAASRPTPLQTPTRVVVRGCAVYVYDAASSDVRIFDPEGRLIGRTTDLRLLGTAVPVASVASPTNATEGTLTTGRLDSGLDQCQWDRITVQLPQSLPPGGGFVVSTFSTNDPDAGPPTDDRGQSGPASAEDFLIRSAPGRFLWIKVRIIGGAASPVIGKLKVYFPRQGYLEYLPAVYQTDPGSRDFLERFLAIFQTGFDGIERVIADIWTLFAARGTPDGFLDWLASWVGMVYQPNWPVANRRELLRRAPELYRRRGTAGGLVLFIELALGIKARVVEDWRARRWLMLGGRNLLGSGTRLFGDCVGGRMQLDVHSRIGEFRLTDVGRPDADAFAAHAHGFTVYVDGPLSEAAVRGLRQLIEQERPAHTDYALKVVGGHLRVGVESSVGLDTGVGRGPRARLGPASTLNSDAVLAGDPSTPEAVTPIVGAMRVG